MKIFLVISCILTLLRPSFAAAGIENILAARKISDLRLQRENDLRGAIQRRTCANQLRLRQAPLNCGPGIIDRHCRGGPKAWTIREIRLALQQRGLSPSCKNKLDSTLEIKLYQAGDGETPDLGPSFEDAESEWEKQFK